MRLFIFCCLLCTLLLTACGGPAYRTRVLDTPESRRLKGYERPYMVNGRRYDPLPDHRGFVQEGIASWYGRKFHGRKTSNGEIYDMYAMTAAHKTLPLGVYVRVTNRRNGRQAVVRINDRGPFVAGRIIDLSYAAARQLDIVETGTAPVRIEALGYRADGRDGYRQPKSYDAGVFAVQVGAFSLADNAYRLAARLRGLFGTASVAEGVVAGRRFFRVRVGRFVSLAAAEKVRAELAAGDFAGAFVVSLQ
ncbi:rare lipoprotein A [Geothermobacter ehrlichii]|uniref:Probable endolytic peptidoglycan transglycosylase RlpA n=1 Tax=Geothermobacter ehrlichii TaxID=213224 RepID=A0A5D3WNC8_9BACT|nr:septal ring lytic transglycosylase RlpA family protein [Geothermobacter ehrlichii]TYP00015.1 rare lipoprotein A [Geothermobacter ehrlichii]